MSCFLVKNSCKHKHFVVSVKSLCRWSHKSHKPSNITVLVNDTLVRHMFTIRLCPCNRQYACTIHTCSLQHVSWGPSAKSSHDLEVSMSRFTIAKSPLIGVLSEGSGFCRARATSRLCQATRDLELIN